MKPQLEPELQAALEAEESGALVALATAGRPEHIKSLRRLATDPAVDPQYRRKALWALGVRGDPEFVPEIEESIPNLGPRERMAAIDALGRIGTARARGAVIRCANDPSPQVRKLVIEALHRMGEGEATIQRMAAEDPEPWVRKIAAKRVKKSS